MEKLENAKNSRSASLGNNVFELQSQSFEKKPKSFKNTSKSNSVIEEPIFSLKNEPVSSL
jgi:hypothetical protein